jgi:lysophospholipase L1-like esterase
MESWRRQRQVAGTSSPEAAREAQAQDSVEAREGCEAMNAERKRSVLALLSVVCLAGSSPIAQQEPRWFAAWSAAHNVGQVVPDLGNSTVRTTVRPTISGQSLRVKLENTRANTPVTFAAAFIGVAGTGAEVVRGTNAKLTFAGAPGVTLKPAEGIWSDPVRFDVKAFQRLTISLDVQSASDVSMHTLGLVSSYVARGARAAESSSTGFAPLPGTAPESTVVEYPIFWLAGVDVRSSTAVGTVVGIGDSWIDGRCSTTENNVVRPDLYQRWLDVLAARLASAFPKEPRAVVNAGIAGNRIIPGGGNGPATLQRLDRDVLERAGVTHVLYLQGMNDIGGGATAAQVTDAMRQVIDRVHAKGLSIIGGTLFPVARPDVVRWTTSMEAQRLAVNAWIRKEAKFDAVIDFDKLMSGGPLYDGNASLKPEFTCDDNVHPNAPGYKAMGELVDLALFRGVKTGRIRGSDAATYIGAVDAIDLEANIKTILSER